MKFEELKAVVALIKYKDCTFSVFEEGRQSFLQISYPVVESGKQPRMAFARMWLLNPDSTRTQIASTAFKAVLAVEEHEARENFTYRGEAVFFPHHDVEALVGLRKLARANIAFGGNLPGPAPEDVGGGAVMQKNVSHTVSAGA